jgi:glutamyl-tRNA synthetase
MTVRVRFAPSPTGYFHVGGAKTALYNWIFARQHGGVLVLRIEDTDAERNQPEWIEGIQSALRWIGCDWDEGPFFQSERADRHTEAAAKLFDAGAAYYCDCTREAVDARNAAHKAATGEVRNGYDGFCRGRGLPAGDGRALRFRTPDDGDITVPDVVRGNPSFDAKTIEDFVVARADGSPLFLLANVVDDGDAAITHVVRGEDHLSNTPKQLLLWRALGYGEAPVYAHLPMMVNEKRQKLSKRRDPVVVSEYREQGYLPEAMANYLSLVGWGPSSGRERLTLAEMVEEFALEDVSSSPGFFDVQKLKAFNGDLIRSLDIDDFVAQVLPFLPAETDVAIVQALAPELQTRVAVLSEAWPLVEFAFVEPTVDAAAFKAGAAEVLDGAVGVFESCEWRAEEIESALRGWGDAAGLKVQAPVRLAISGVSKGLPLGVMIEVLGRERAVARLRAARALL